MVLKPDMESQNAYLRSIQITRQPKPIAAFVRGSTPQDIEPVEFVPERTAVRKRLGDLDLSWHTRVRTAVEAARAWQQRRKEQQATPGTVVNASLILLATAVIDASGRPDMKRTGYGCGKTHIAEACMWAEALFMDGSPVAPAGKFFEAKRLLSSLGGDNDIAAEIGGAPIIVVDEVGDEGFLQFVRQDAESQAYERQARYRSLVDYCYRRGVSLVITSNLTASELAEHIGGRAWDRLMQMAPTGFIVDMTGVPSWRVKESGR